MPKAKVWPEPLEPGTPVVCTDASGRRTVGTVASSEILRKYRGYRLNEDRGLTVYQARKVRPLDMQNPDDVEVWLDG